MFMKDFAIKSLCLYGLVSLTACSSGSDSNTTVAGGGRGGSEFGFVTLNITDAPIDYASEVWVQFDGVEFMPAATAHSQQSILVMLDAPMSINLLELQGTKSKALLTNEVLPTGLYDWVRLKLTAVRDGVLDSYIVLTDGSAHELDMPDGSEVGLKIDGGLEVIANTPSSKTIDFDLRKSIVMTGPSDYEIRPVLNIVSDNLSGSIDGTIKFKNLIASSCSDFNPFTGNAVYLYEGHDILPDDEGGAGQEPFASALVRMNVDTGAYEYSFGFVPFGDYTAAFTCEADADDPSADDAIRFSTTSNVSITTVSVTLIGKNEFRFNNGKGNN